MPLFGIQTKFSHTVISILGVKLKINRLKKVKNSIEKQAKECGKGLYIGGP